MLNTFIRMALIGIAMLRKTSARRTAPTSALGTRFTELKVRRDPDCPICSRDPGEIPDEEMGVFPDYEAFCAAAG